MRSCKQLFFGGEEKMDPHGFEDRNEIEVVTDQKSKYDFQQ